MSDPFALHPVFPREVVSAIHALEPAVKVGEIIHLSGPNMPSAFRDRRFEVVGVSDKGIELKVLLQDGP